MRLAFSTVKGISSAETARLTAGQPYTGLQDLWQRARPSLPVAQRLIRIGALDALSGDLTRRDLLPQATVRTHGIKPVIPQKADQAANRKKKGRRGGRPVTHDAELYRDRNIVERLINKLKVWRGIATRYVKTPESHLAALHLRGAIVWLHSLRSA